MIPETTGDKVINYQHTKSGTSAYANYRAALRGRSKVESFNKLSSAERIKLLKMPASMRKRAN